MSDQPERSHFFDSTTPPKKRGLLATESALVKFSAPTNS